MILQGTEMKTQDETELPKLAILTIKNSVFGKKTLNELKNKGIKVSAVIVINQPLKYYLRQLLSVLKRTGILQTFYFSVERVLKGFLNSVTIKSQNDLILDYEKLAETVYYTNGTNSESTLNMLKDISPGILILGQTGIVKKNLLEIPALGTLNAHPAVLPDYRGIDCNRWAILNDDWDKIGCTVHWVDAGVDTGRIILKKRYEFRGDETIEKLDANLADMSISALIEVIKKKLHLNNGEKQKNEAGKQYYKMRLEKENIVRKKLKRFIKQTDVTGN